MVRSEAPASSKRRTLRLALAAAALLWTAPFATPAQAAPDQGITSATHRKHVGRIVFSAEPIPFRREQPARFRTTFRSADKVYGRVYLARSLGNTPHFTSQGHRTPGGARGEWAVRVTVDGKEQKIAFGWFHKDPIMGQARTHYTSFQVNLNAPGDVPADRKLRTAWARTVAKLAPGRHAVRVEVHSLLGSFQTRGPVAWGTFTLVKRAGEGPSAGSMPAARMRDRGLEGAMRRALLSKRVAKRAGDIRRVVITSGWQPGVYAGTRVRYRKVNGTVLWKAKDGGNLCRYVTYKFVSDRKGGGWTPLRFRGFCNGCPEGFARCR